MHLQGWIRRHGLLQPHRIDITASVVEVRTSMDRFGVDNLQNYASWQNKKQDLLVLLNEWKLWVEIRVALGARSDEKQYQSSDSAAWFKWANGVPEGCLYYLSALACKNHIGAATGADHPFKKLIKDFGPERCEDDHWMEDEDQVRAALSRRSRYMLGGLEGNALINHMRQLSESRWMRDRLPFHSLLEGSQVKITRNGSLVVLRWM
ncbi:hypothetical protein O0I10_012298 [Lichtheimia ornata]|uniref:Uncharacterized protein n=1 Tax=Lichtheimia ornata TaxID=688661 RepID=A0AAD7USX3_9FUNG|nr:uncharacterized protein O0I10_012298 [Lichtheimia ornata]KAJ8652067.1 hypothetical protein O0I10_012298 [Lichtheimia ornata]